MSCKTNLGKSKNIYRYVFDCSLGKIRKLQNCDILQPPSGSGRKGWLTWGYDTLVKSPISWGWKTLTKESSEEDNPRYILESCLNVNI